MTSEPVPTGPRSAAAIQDWIVAWLANELPQPAEIDPTKTFDSYGASSLVIVTMTGDLQDWLGFPVDPSTVYDYPTIERLAAHLGASAGAGR